MAKNPYIEQPRPALYASAQRRAGKLLAGPHSDTGHLLLAMAMQLHLAGMATRGPGDQLKGSGSLLDAYSTRLERLQRDARHEVLRDATDLVLGNRAFRWLRSCDGPGSPYYRALESDAGLREVLAELEALRTG